MALDQKFFKKSTTAATGTADQVQGLISHLDANDVDSYDGDGSIWYDIASYNVNVPLADKASNLVLNLDGGTYTSGAWEDQSDNTNNASLKKSEPIDSRFCDVMNYCLLGYALFVERDGKKNN